LGGSQARDKAAEDDYVSEGVRKTEWSIADMTKHLNQPVRVGELAARADGRLAQSGKSSRTFDSALPFNGASNYQFA
jgi:hypothetical protein